MNLYDNNKKIIGIVNYKICTWFFARKKDKSFVITTKNFCGVKTIKKINLKLQQFCGNIDHILAEI